MANVKVAINGFGRIGRLAFRQMFDAEGYEIVAINDLTSPKMLAHLLKYDSAQGRYKYCDSVVAGEDSITVNGKTIKIYAEKDAANLPWKQHDVDVVLECTGFYCSKDKASAHIKAGAKKCVISAPAGNDLPTVVFSVNEKTLKASDTVISAASCTTNCLAPMADALNKLCKITKGYMTTIHAYTGDQMVLDGCAQRVPVPTGSLTQLIAVCQGEVDATAVNDAMKAASSSSYGYTEEEIVSSDVIGMTYGSLFDATQTKCMPLGDGSTLVKVVSWYDNENSYTSQMVRTIKYFAELK